jgi:hypothetical protein
MEPEIVSVLFSVTVHSNAERFVVPIKAREALDLVKDRDEIQLWIHSSTGSFCVVKTLMSGSEIYGPGIDGRIKTGERILVEASRPARKHQN